MISGHEARRAVLKITGDLLGASKSGLRRNSQQQKGIMRYACRQGVMYITTKGKEGPLLSVCLVEGRRIHSTLYRAMRDWKNISTNVCLPFVPPIPLSLLIDAEQFVANLIKSFSVLNLDNSVFCVPSGSALQPVRDFSFNLARESAVTLAAISAYGAAWNRNSGRDLFALKAKAFRLVNQELMNVNDQLTLAVAVLWILEVFNYQTASISMTLTM
jgi:hypothetical protein